MKKWVFASGNQGKWYECQTALSPLDIILIPQREFSVFSIEETGLTFVENAILKARHAAKVTGLPALADDSGLTVAALKGEPGIYSARYAGPDATMEKNIDFLLQKIQDIPESELTCAYICVMVLVQHEKDPTPVIAQAKWLGHLCKTRQGEDGFGYDPIFWVDDLHCTAAELTVEHKNKLSHRGKALKKLVTALK